MGGNGKHRWKFSIHRTPTSSKLEPKGPPKEFLCPISGSLMVDPVVVSTGQTFERVSAQVCRDLNFFPKLEEDGSNPDFSTMITNLNMKTTILNWCHDSGTPPPRAPDYSAVERIVWSLIGEQKPEPSLRVSERELLKGVAEKPAVKFTHAATELGHRVNHFYSSSEESVVVGAGSTPGTPLPFTTRPTCYSSSSSASSSGLVETETLIPNSTSSEEEARLIQKLKSSEVVNQEEGVISLRKITRSNEQARVSLCTPLLLLALRNLISSRYAVVQVNAVASLVNLSLEKPNKVKIVRSGFVPPLIDVLKSGLSESQEHAAGALFSLALEDENKMAIGVLGALQPLMHVLRSESERTRNDSALCLYHLSLTQSNRVKLVKLGAVPSLLSMVKSGNLVSRVLLILCNLAVCHEARSVMLDSNGVGTLVGMLRGNELDSESTREHCVAALYALSHGGFRFKGLAKEARAVEVLREVEERGSERAREKAKRILQMMKGREQRDDEFERLNESALDSDELGWTRNRVGVGEKNANSTNF